MVGSSAVAAWVAQAVFWGLLLWGVARRGLSPRRSVVFLMVWLAGRVVCPYVPYGPAMFSSYVAAIDIALVLMVFKGDVRLW
jgi:hypothetical protein